MGERPYRITREQLALAVKHHEPAATRHCFARDAADSGSCLLPDHHDGDCDYVSDAEIMIVDVSRSAPSQFIVKRTERSGGR